MRLVKGPQVFETDDIRVIHAYMQNGWAEDVTVSEPAPVKKPRKKASNND